MRKDLELDQLKDHLDKLKIEKESGEKSQKNQFKDLQLKYETKIREFKACKSELQKAVKLLEVSFLKVKH